MTENKKLTIDEAIKYARQVAEKQRNYFALSGEFMGDTPGCVKCAEEHEQLAEWLEELKEARKGFEENRRAGYQHGYSDGYKKAIDEFAGKIALEISESIIWGMLVDSDKDNSFRDTSDKIVDYVIDTAKKIAEQMEGET